MDTYKDFGKLQAVEQEGHDFRIATRFRDDSRTVILAPHGGAIEPGTSELALAVAADDLHLAILEGTKPRGNSDLHITSTNFDEPRCVGVVEQSDFVLAIHGERSSNKVVYIGGADIDLRNAISEALAEGCYDVREHQNINLQGKALQNICNRGKNKMGVQLELARGLRTTFFSSLSAEGRKSKTSEFQRFVEVLRRGLQRGGAI
jgi:phage replication-related protein YjqB (UPF0714/DUF867 family)